MPTRDEHLALALSVGQRIRARRQRCHLTQMALAKATGLSRPAIANVESGRQRVALADLYVIAEECRCEIFDLIPKTVAEAQDDMGLRAQALAKLTPKERHALGY